ncbi:class I SAM-dependent methyltransferase [Cryomorpha ignava]|uniref:Class I SAM-dependent methyltransferase n=1 Tax=Cryomorpha ignava TaxID=101383 RepID=A0A7K3WP53_9FLAO|nr:class I SAM-dependent methyltransferase [Cryomorpha ignava]NEN23430.1 class I SAM-dependent methyltransferase [Cryomorpha ignava]
MSQGNKIQDDLVKIGVVDPERVREYFPRVRDREDVGVMKCEESGVIFLSRSDHMHMNHYEEMSDLEYWGKGSREQSLETTLEDDTRRAMQFADEIAGKYWVDIGTGLGGVLDIAGGNAKKVGAVEPQIHARKCLTDLGYDVRGSIAELDDNSVDVFTLFHVLEHFIDPIEELKKVYEKLKPGGKVIIEVPHARDFLLSFLDLESFKKFTFWSEHLILHTRESIEKLLQFVGFKDVVVDGFQRYRFANHLHWLAREKPGGHIKWNDLSTDALDKAYAEMLVDKDYSDTLVAVGVKG